MHLNFIYIDKHFVKCPHFSVDYSAVVVKASGLAAGKGVVVATSRQEACQAARSMLSDKMFGAAGETIVVEELLEGEEVSVSRLCSVVLRLFCLPVLYSMIEHCWF